MENEPFGDPGLIMEALMEIREKVRYIVWLLEEDGEEAEEEDA